jgi:thioredoxin-related protein
MLERSVYSSKQFKDMSKYFVFVKINSDRQSKVAQDHQVRALPTLKFMDTSGKVIHTQVGAMPLQQFVGMMNHVRKSVGK